MDFFSLSDQSLKKEWDVTILDIIVMQKVFLSKVTFAICLLTVRPAKLFHTVICDAYLYCIILFHAKIFNVIPKTKYT